MKGRIYCVSKCDRCSFVLKNDAEKTIECNQIEESISELYSESYSIMIIVW